MGVSIQNVLPPHCNYYIYAGVVYQACQYLSLLSMQVIIIQCGRTDTMHESRLLFSLCNFISIQVLVIFVKVLSKN